MKKSSKELKATVERLLQETGGNRLTDISKEDINRGKKTVEQILGIESVSNTWENRKKTNIVKWLMLQSNVTADQLAAYLGCSKQYLNNKFNRNSFSFDDVVIAAYACSFTLVFVDNDGSIERRIDVKDYFEDDIDTWQRISGLHLSGKESKRAEYEQKKAELEQMKKAYGFDD